MSTAGIFYQYVGRGSIERKSRKSVAFAISFFFFLTGDGVVVSSRLTMVMMMYIRNVIPVDITKRCCPNSTYSCRKLPTNEFAKNTYPLQRTYNVLSGIRNNQFDFLGTARYHDQCSKKRGWGNGISAPVRGRVTVTVYSSFSTNHSSRDVRVQNTGQRSALLPDKKENRKEHLDRVLRLE